MLNFFVSTLFSLLPFSVFSVSSVVNIPFLILFVPISLVLKTDMRIQQSNGEMIRVRTIGVHVNVI